MSIKLPVIPLPAIPDRWRKARPLAVTAILAFLVCGNLLFYTPLRLSRLYGLYDVKRAYLEPFLTPEAQKLTPALIIVHIQEDWIEYGRLTELQTPFLDTPFIFIYSRQPETNQAVAAHFPDRHVYHYYPVKAPYTFYLHPSP